MNLPENPKPFVAIACGGTGGHLFPGLAVAEQLKQRGCEVGLLISPKEVDQQAVKAAGGMAIFTLPAVGLQNRNYFSFARSFWKSFQAARAIFKTRRPAAVLAMGGFTSAPPVLAARKFGAKTFLHDSNTIPGKANRFLARWVDEAFIGFPEAAARLRAKKISVTGTPVRPQFQVRDPAACRLALGLEPNMPTVLVVGGSQGASGLNDLILSALKLMPRAQWLHLTGAKDFEAVKAAYAAAGIKAVVKPFLAEMELALGAATACVSRAGASSLAEIAAMRLPSALVPLPTSADHHQWSNALAFENTGAAMLLDQRNSSPEKVAETLTTLVRDEITRLRMEAALAQWHAPASAEIIAKNILNAIGQGAGQPARGGVKPAAGGEIKLRVVT
ncbi:MAG TPA: undecaprenyldiphospho-muramoylpentapeptide beta-N-acetylglucosaminyltransferase [Candidatus Acidoferrales bacterium]|nr:undecaprenyldiphospho-muramoylpentapeptide beta-N-acetylglucosaminyltransferase [Candidatus Acidoferrales bacterium]